MKKWGPIITAITIIGGVSIGLYLGKLLVPDLPAGTIAACIGGAITGVSIVLGIEQLRKRKKSNNIPDIDERTWLNIKNFYAVSLYFVLIGSMLLLCILFALGMRTIGLGALSIYLLLIFMLITVGTHIVKRQ
jgi:Ca2+/Na+ antiporter